MKVPEVKAEFTDGQQLNGYEILNRYFDETFTRNPAVIAFGEEGT